MHTPAIAVVIPVSNAGRFIDESIDSVCAQTTPQWE
jgi:glycosyltransferase involved in cell wall biosynthesis